jgi:DNA repair protein RecN (Recombination protein N)
MLTKLFVKNYALIEELDIDFGNGLTIITGETGAGKSILLGALSLVLGSRADTSVLLNKTDKCIVEGTFNIDGYGLDGFFEKYEIDYSPITIIRREINPAGKSRAFINDTPVNLNQLSEIGDKLIDIHSQHQTLMLNESVFQLSVLDSFTETVKLREEYSKVYKEYKAYKKEYEGLRENYEKNRADFEYYSFQIEQLENAKLVAGELEELEKEQELLTHAEEIKSGLTNAADLFSSDDSPSILNMLKESKSYLSKIAGYLEKGEELLGRTESVYIELDDIATEIIKIAEETEANPERLQIIRERIDLLFSLIQKHRVNNIDELLSKKIEIRNIVERLVTSDDRILELESAIANQIVELEQLAANISKSRKDVLPGVEHKVTELLKNLGMPNARFLIELTDTNDFTPTGKNRAEFMFSANKQIQPENLSKTASGGELSRVMLSLKSFLSRNSGLPTIIFDEIDSGVSGEVANKVGVILNEMGRFMQVINITHLPQVAARGNVHYHVYKDDSGETTVTRIRLLTNEERTIEIARLLSGSEITQAALSNAKELISNS